MFTNYILYLDYISNKLNKFFERQKPYIFCKKGCAKCCQNAEFPYSQMEASFLLQRALTLPIETQNQIQANILEVFEQKKNFKGEKFRYNCPFLINNECSVYAHRGVICRTFGLMTISEDESVKVPFCCYDGLNYSNVVEGEESKVSEEKFKQLGVEQEPLAFNINYSFLTSEKMEKDFNFKFGEKKPLIDWFIENIESIEKIEN